MAVVIGSARGNEYGGANNGLPGDQKQIEQPDYKGEVSLEPFYVHKLGWVVIRPRSAKIAITLASKMLQACNNKNIGYDQNRRHQIWQYGTGSTTKCSCDCSSLVRQCILEAGIQVENFTTFNEKAKIAATGQFDCYPYEANLRLQTGDILVTKTKGHTAIVVSTDNPNIGNEIDIDDIARRVIRGEFGTGATRRQKLESIRVGLYAQVQRRVNQMLIVG